MSRGMFCVDTLNGYETQKNGYEIRDGRVK